MLPCFHFRGRGLQERDIGRGIRAANLHIVLRTVNVPLNQTGSLGARERGKALSPRLRLMDLEASPKRLNVEPHIVGFRTKIDEAETGRLQLSLNRRWIDDARHPGGEVNNAWRRGPTWLPGNIRGKSRTLQENDMGPAATNHCRIVSKGDSEAL